MNSEMKAGEKRSDATSNGSSQLTVKGQFAGAKSSRPGKALTRLRPPGRVTHSLVPFR